LVLIKYPHAPAATQAPEASPQGEDPDCGGDAAAHYGGMEIPRPACHRQRSGISASVLVSLQMANILNICLECLTTFAVSAEF